MRAAATLMILAAGIATAAPLPPVPVIAAPGEGGVRVAADGVIGIFYRAAGAGPHPAILALGGSEGGVGTGLDRQARALRAAGFSVLALSYFGAPGQPPALAAIPLETFDHGLAWLARAPGVDPARMEIVGGSKGAEAALIVATRHAELKAVVAGMPSSVAWPAIGGAGETASWTAAGRPVAVLPYGAFDPASGVFGLYAKGLATLPAHPDAAIPVERIAAPVLLVCGEADRLWPSCPMARQVAARAGGHPRVDILAYADAGHAVFGVPLASGDPRAASLASLGGSVTGNLAARDDGWPRVVAFLKAALAR